MAELLIERFRQANSGVIDPIKGRYRVCGRYLELSRIAAAARFGSVATLSQFGFVALIERICVLAVLRYHRRRGFNSPTRFAGWTGITQQSAPEPDARSC